MLQNIDWANVKNPHLFINGDCMEYMKTMPDKYVDLCICDPPYGLPKDSTHGRGKLKNRILNNGSLELWDKQPSLEYFKELRRVSVNQIIWGGNYFDLPPTRGIICWDKCQPWENFSQWEMIWTSFDCPAFIIRYSNTGGANKEEKIHPCQKPVPVYSKLLNKFAKQGFKIIDTHVGSASSLIACHNYGFEYVGFEIGKGEFESATRRLEAVKAQVSMFV